MPDTAPGAAERVAGLVRRLLVEGMPLDDAEAPAPPHVRHGLLSVLPRFWDELTTRFGAEGVDAVRAALAEAVADGDTQLAGWLDGYRRRHPEAREPLPDLVDRLDAALTRAPEFDHPRLEAALRDAFEGPRTADPSPPPATDTPAPEPPHFEPDPVTAGYFLAHVIVVALTESVRLRHDTHGYVLAQVRDQAYETAARWRDWRRQSADLPGAEAYVRAEIARRLERLLGDPSPALLLGSVGVRSSDAPANRAALAEPIFDAARRTFDQGPSDDGEALLERAAAALADAVGARRHPSTAPAALTAKVLAPALTPETDRFAAARLAASLDALISTLTDAERAALATRIAAHPNERPWSDTVQALLADGADPAHAPRVARTLLDQLAPPAADGAGPAPR
ncbi:MAG: hypothetical protein R3F65_18175 [bacterium]